MVNCSVSKCKSRSTNSNLREHGVSYHLFPKDPMLREKWKKFCGKQASWIPKRTSTICSIHFASECFDGHSTERRILIYGAIPTLKFYQLTIKNESLLKTPRNLVQRNLSYSKKENHTYITMKHIKGSNNIYETDTKIPNDDIYVCNVNIEPDYDSYDEMSDKCGFDDCGKYCDDEELENKYELVIDEEVIVKTEPNLESDNEMCVILDIRPNSPNETAEDQKELTIETDTTTKAKPKVTKNVKKGEKRVDRRLREPKDIENDFEIEYFRTEEEQRVEFKKRRCSKNYLESEFTCEKCLKGFREKSLLTLHMRKHDKSSGDIVCKICLIRVPTAKHYRTHRDGNHIGKYKCKRCDFLTYSLAQARYHHRWHQGVEHRCPHCGITFRKYTTFMGHVRMRHPSQYICGTCALSFVTGHGLNHHRRIAHKDQGNNSEASEKTSCTDCDVVFDSYKIYVKHLKISPKHVDIAKTIIACRECGEQFDDEELLSQHKHRKREKTTKKRTCPQCNEEFSYHSGLYHHFMREHPGMQYTVELKSKTCLCEECGKTYNSQSTLLAHKRLHTGERPYVCKVCQKAFRTAHHLAKHNNSHIGAKDFACDVCSKAYTSASNLFKHKRIHERVKLFKCDICAKSFVDSSNLRQHIQGVHFNVKRNRRR